MDEWVLRIFPEIYKTNNLNAGVLGYAGGPGVPCYRKSSSCRGEGQRAAQTVPNRAGHNDEVSSSGAGGVLRAQSEGSAGGSVTGNGPGPEGSSPTVNSRRSEGGGAEELLRETGDGYECPPLACPAPDSFSFYFAGF